MVESDFEFKKFSLTVGDEFTQELDITKTKHAEKHVNIKSSTDIVLFMKHNTDWVKSIDIVESIYIAGLDRANNLIFAKKIAQGGISSTVLDIRVISFLMINHLASNLIVIHNHPSGNLTFSREDLNLRAQLSNAADVLGFQLMDFIIVNSTFDYLGYM